MSYLDKELMDMLQELTAAMEKNINQIREARALIEAKKEVDENSFASGLDDGCGHDEAAQDLNSDYWNQ